MAFDDISEDAEEAYPCPACSNGTVRLDKEDSATWRCDHCEWHATKSGE